MAELAQIVTVVVIAIAAYFAMNSRGPHAPA